MGEGAKELRFGALYHHKRFRYDDGEVGIKYILLLTELGKIGTDDYYIFVKTTTQENTRKKSPPCDPRNLTFFVQSDGICPTKDIWVQFHQLYRFTAGSVLEDCFCGDLEFKCLFNEKDTRALKNCLIKAKAFIPSLDYKAIMDSFDRRFPKT